MKKYEGLFILNTAGKEDSVKDMIDRVTNEITAVGGKVETVQKMDKRTFSRIADKKYNAGFYVNVIFEAKPETVASLGAKLRMSEDIFRVLFTEASEVKAPVAA
jgi:small subunit ribosomal protein S6